MHNSFNFNSACPLEIFLLARSLFTNREQSTSDRMLHNLRVAQRNNHFAWLHMRKKKVFSWVFVLVSETSDDRSIYSALLLDSKQIALNNCDSGDLYGSWWPLPDDIELWRSVSVSVKYVAIEVDNRLLSGLWHGFWSASGQQQHEQTWPLLYSCWCASPAPSPSPPQEGDPYDATPTSAPKHNILKRRRGQDACAPPTAPSPGNFKWSRWTFQLKDPYITNLQTYFVVGQYRTVSLVGQYVIYVW